MADTRAGSIPVPTCVNPKQVITALEIEIGKGQYYLYPIWFLLHERDDDDWLIKALMPHLGSMGEGKIMPWHGTVTVEFQVAVTEEITLDDDCEDVKHAIEVATDRAMDKIPNRLEYMDHKATVDGADE